MGLSLNSTISTQGSLLSGEDNPFGVLRELFFVCGNVPNTFANRGNATDPFANRLYDPEWCHESQNPGIGRKSLFASKTHYLVRKLGDRHLKAINSF